MNLAMSKRRVVTLLCATTLAVSVLSACSRAELATPSPTGATAAPGAGETASEVTSRQLDAAWQQKSFEKFYKQDIAWKPCTAEDGLSEELAGMLKDSGKDPSSFECAAVQIPLNWADPADERTATLAVSRFANGGSKDFVPLLTNPGGPGIPGIQHAALLATSKKFDPVLKNHTLWGFDPRGVGKSTPVTCDSTSTIQAVQLAECAKKYPIANYMGTSQVARDMELLRVLAGGVRLDYLGYSYGTILGATYASIFPDKAGRMVLDSANTAKWSTLTHTYDQAVASAKAAARLGEVCPSMVTPEGKPVTCPFTSERELIDLRKKLDANPLKASDGTQIAGKELRDFMSSALYGDPSGSLDLLGRAKGGDQEAIDEIATQLAGGGAKIDTVGQLVVCPSTPKTEDVSGLIEHINKVGVPEYLGGPEITDDVLSEYLEFDCATLSSTGSDFTNSFNAAETKNKLLVIGITGDHATPYEHSKELAEQLGNASFLTLDSNGHGASFSELSSCIDKAVTDYLVDGTSPRVGLVCQADAAEGERQGM
ncbi:alpha/beta fold hydrolase [Trueperella pyogenes]|uniref:alpha/beta fold hydrolase n=2 Tax=Trueperella pyogenes TaxID=1661 RepID=UPI000D52DE1F|nr:alpha/beta fold hydrolase [Trueperella pyogenes]AWG04316.1 alpha/beta hydrolase [Trueperella pyogenes]AWG17043.1 alpha/beta hydrolase [Trueperella pyogenes]AZR04035.1 alpha/beta hydrolase [Trueperella pyogenes]